VLAAVAAGDQHGDKADGGVADDGDDREALGFKAYLLSVKSRNYQQLEGQMDVVKNLLGSTIRFPYNRRISRQSGNFTKEDWEAWLHQASREDLADALTVVAHLNQTKAQ
jgi:hypothetical protein